MCSLSSEEQGKEDSATFSLGEFFFFFVFLFFPLVSCRWTRVFLRISGLIDLVIGRSGWHAGMARSTRTHADTHTYCTFSCSIIFRKTLKRKNLCILTLLKTHTRHHTLSFISQASALTETKYNNFPYREICSTNSHTNNIILLSNSHKMYSRTIVYQHIGCLITTSTHCSLC